MSVLELMTPNAAPSSAAAAVRAGSTTAAGVAPTPGLFGGAADFADVLAALGSQTLGSQALGSQALESQAAAVAGQRPLGAGAELSDPAALNPDATAFMSPVQAAFALAQPPAPLSGSADPSPSAAPGPETTAPTGAMATPGLTADAAVSPSGLSQSAVAQSAVAQAGVGAVPTTAANRTSSPAAPVGTPAAVQGAFEASAQAGVTASTAASASPAAVQAALQALAQTAAPAVANVSVAAPGSLPDQTAPGTSQPSATAPAAATNHASIQTPAQAGAASTSADAAARSTPSIANTGAATGSAASAIALPTVASQTAQAVASAAGAEIAAAATPQTLDELRQAGQVQSTERRTERQDRQKAGEAPATGLTASAAPPAGAARLNASGPAPSAAASTPTGAPADPITTAEAAPVVATLTGHGDGDSAEAARPEPTAPSVQTAQAVRDAPPPGLARATIETTALMAAQMIRRLDQRSTRFEMALTPEGLGRVDVSMEIDSDGRMAARMAFDNPAAALDLRARVDELRRQLEAAGFTLADDALEFAERDGGASGHAFDRGREGRPNRAFAGARALSEQADARVGEHIPLSATRYGVDMKV